MEKSDTLQRYNVVNPNLKKLHIELSAMYAKFNRPQPHGAAAPAAAVAAMDAHVLFLYGLVLRDLDATALARQVLLQSVKAYPWNWSAWKTLSTLCTDQPLVSA
jgi:hypothetical protein